MSIIKSVFTNVIGVKVKVGDKTLDKTIVQLAPWKPTVKETRESFDTILGEGQGVHLLKALKGGLAINGYDTNKKAVKEDYKSILDADQCAGQTPASWPKKDTKQWENLINLVTKVANLSEGGTITAAEFNVWAATTAAIYTFPAIAEELSHREGDETKHFLDAILGVIMGVTEADPADAAKAIADANGTRVEAPSAAKPETPAAPPAPEASTAKTEAPPATNEQLPAPPTTAAVSPEIVNKTRETMEQIVAPLVQNDQDLEAVMEILNRVRQRGVNVAAATMSTVKADLQALGVSYDDVVNAAKALPAEAAPAAVPAEVEEEGV